MKNNVHDTLRLLERPCYPIDSSANIKLDQILENQVVIMQGLIQQTENQIAIMNRIDEIYNSGAIQMTLKT